MARVGELKAGTFFADKWRKDGKPFWRVGVVIAQFGDGTHVKFFDGLAGGPGATDIEKSTDALVVVVPGLPYVQWDKLIWNP